MSLKTLAPLPPLYHVYAGLTALAQPILHRKIRTKMTNAGVEALRREERLGYPTEERPLGQLIWIHAVSVGEFQSILGLLKELRQTRPDISILVTTTTATAAKLAETRLPPGCLHQFSPLDTPAAVERFLEHWQPDMAVFVESEIWPRQIVQIAKRDIPLCLINSRLSASSIKTWKRLPRLAKALLTRFDLILCQTQNTSDAFAELGYAPTRTHVSGDLKKSSDPLPVDQPALSELQGQLNGRPVWLAASTHPGEEEHVLAAHKLFCETHPEGLLILLPRHPERGGALEQMIKTQGWQASRRSKGEAITPETQVYLADTLGETGTFYSLAPMAFVGGSFTDVGGHNPFEPAHFNCAVLHGPLYANFAQAYVDMGGHWASREVNDSDDLGTTLLELHQSNDLISMQKAALGFVENSKGIRKNVATQLLLQLGH